jgi:hypothetical protein
MRSMIRRLAIVMTVGCLAIVASAVPALATGIIQ